MSVDLVFRGSPNGPGPVNLVFGATEGAGSTVDFTLDATMPGLTFEGTARYVSGADRPLVAATGSAWQVGAAAQGGVEHRSQDNTRTATHNAPTWGLAKPVATTVRNVLPFGLLPSRAARTGTFERAARVAAGDRHSAWAYLGRGQRPEVSSTFAEALGRRASGSDTWQEAQRTRARLASLFGEATALGLQFVDHAQAAVQLTMFHGAPWQEAIRPPAGVYVRPTVPVDPPADPCYIPPVGDAVDLLFSTPWKTGVDLIFICDRHGTTPPATVVVPVKGVYMVLNNTALRRVSDNALIPCLQMGLTIDAESWTWGFTASVPAEAQRFVESATGDPIELVAHISGTNYRVLAESISRERTFGKSSIRVTGRGRAAVLDAPYAPTLSFSNAEQRTAQQLMNDVLTSNGASLGWDVDWGLTDWLVPAGVFSHQGSYISAVTAIAAAAGGYVQPHATDQTLRILPRYAAAPWNWGIVAPDFELPSSIATREGVTWTKKPDYNRVFLSGQQSGLLGQITRAGTPGDILAPMVTDALLTDSAALSQRGLSILADTGRRLDLSLRMPVLTETGLILPGKFVRYVDGADVRIGVVRSTSVDLTGTAQVWQTIGVETHA